MKQLLRLRPLFLLPSKSTPPSLRLSSAAAAAAATATVDSPSPSQSLDHLLSETNLLIPRLCHSDHIPEAIRLLAAALSATADLPPSFSVLADHLTSHPSMADSMALINRLKYNPATQTSLLPVTRTLIHSYLKKRRSKEVVKVFQWMLRPDSVCAPDRQVFTVLVSGLFDCRAEFEGLRALREMIRAGFGPGPELRAAVYGGLLRLAMVREARALDGALESVGLDEGEGDRALKLLDDIIFKWED